MKKIVFLIGFLPLFLLNSCDLLDLAPEDYYGSGNFWNTAAQVDGYMLGLHNLLRNDHQSFYLLGEARGGTTGIGNTAIGTTNINSSPIKDNALTKDATGISGWQGYYARIMQVNIFISEVENGCTFLSDNDRNYYLGQAYGIRAFYYFMLYRTFGGVPVISTVKVLEGVTHASGLYTPRSTPKQTLDFIKDDINKSDQYFGQDFSIKRTKSLWSKPATLMLKANIYLWSAKVTTGDQTPSATDLQTAKDAITPLIGRFSLLPNFGNVFGNANKGNDEIIFAIRFLEGEATNFNSEFVYQPVVFVNMVYDKEGKLMGDTLDLRNTGSYRHTYKYELYERYDADDQRRDATFLDFYMRDGDGNVINKALTFRKAIGRINATGIRLYDSDIPVFRYAEALLLMAEIENKAGGDPSSYINEIRQRAYGDNYDPVIHAHVNQGFEANELAILYERDMEFVWEGKRWFDVCRMTDDAGRPLVFSNAASYGSSLPILNYSAEAHKLLWPVDVNTLNTDPELTQTPGY